MWHGFYGGGWTMWTGGALLWGSIIFLIARDIHRATRHHCLGHSSDYEAP